MDDTYHGVSSRRQQIRCSHADESSPFSDRLRNREAIAEVGEGHLGNIGTYLPR